MKSRKTSGGFTLVELMITVVVISILSAIAIPGYRTFVARAQRTDARTALLRIQAAEEKFFLQNNTYTANITAAGNATPPGLGLTSSSENGQYDLAVTIADGGASFTATATPRSGTGQYNNDRLKCASFTITHTGAKTATGTQSAKCWK